MKADAIQTLLQTSANSVGQPIAYPPVEKPEVTVFFVEMAPGEETGWHSHPVPLLGYMLSGEVTIYLADGRKRVVRAGGTSLESVDLAHNGINEGTEPARMVVFVLGEKDVPHTVEEKSPR